MKGRVPRRDTSSLRDLRVVPPLCFALECGLSGDASSADGNAAEDSVVNEAPRLPSITEGLHFHLLIEAQATLRWFGTAQGVNDVPSASKSIFH